MDKFLVVHWYVHFIIFFAGDVDLDLLKSFNTSFWCQQSGYIYKYEILTLMHGDCLM